MSASHTIRLQGPWLVDTCTGQTFNTEILNVRSAEDWTRWWEQNRFAGQLTLARRFNWNWPEPAPKTIQLIISGRPPNQVVINEQSVECHSEPDGCRADITRQIQDHNGLKLVYQLDEVANETRLIHTVNLLLADD